MSHCPWCDYPLRQSAEPKDGSNQYACTECGTIFTVRELRRQRIRRLGPRLAGLCLATALLVASTNLFVQLVGLARHVVLITICLLVVTGVVVLVNRMIDPKRHTTLFLVVVFVGAFLSVPAALTLFDLALLTRVLLFD